jgi:hypothetical protein
MIATAVNPSDGIPGGLLGINDSELLMATGANTLLLVPMAGGQWQEWGTEWLWGDGIRRPSGDGPLVGWNAEGIWTLPQVFPDALGDALTGRLFPLPRDSVAISTTWEGGFQAPGGRTAALWRSGCELRNVVHGSGPCERYFHTLWLHDLRTHTNSLLAAYRVNVTSGQYWKLHFGGGSFSPDGRSVAYLIDGDVYVSAVP